MIDIVKTKRLVLRTPFTADAVQLARAINHYDVAKYILCPHPYTQADAEWFIVGNATKDAPAKSIFLDGELIGAIELDADFELGYWITPSQWSKGIVTEACNAMLERHFARDDASDVTSGYQPDNMGSAIVQQRLGFVESKRGIISDDKWGELDHIDTVLTRDNWLAAQGLPLCVDDLILRPVTSADVKVLQGIAGNDDVAPMLWAISVPWTDNAILKWIEERRCVVNEHWCLMIEKDGVPVGVVGLGHDPVDLYYFVDKEYWGQGIATRASRALLRHMFDQTELDQIRADSFTDNPASIAVLGKLGFEKTGDDVGGSAARLEPAPLFVYRLTRTKFESLS
jgi:RimJ/RimL family protein N-acetyltransferase